MRLQVSISLVAACYWALASLSTVSAAVAPNPDPTYHIPRIGVPKLSSLTSASQFLTPRFHRIIRADEDKSKKTNTALFVASEQGGFGALNPRNGDIVWRRVVNDTDPVQGFWLSADVALYLTGHGATRATVHNALTGRLEWSQLLSLTDQSDPSTSSASHDSVPPWAGPGCDASFVAPGFPAGDIIVLDGAKRVRRLDGTTGQQRWRWSEVEVTRDRTLVRVLASEAAVHVVSLAPTYSTLPLIGSKEPTGFDVRIYTLSLTDGKLLDIQDVGAAIAPVGPLAGYGGKATTGGAANIALVNLAATRPRQGSEVTPAGQKPPLQPHLVWVHKDGTIKAVSWPVGLESPPDDAAPAIQARQAPNVLTLKALSSNFVALREVNLGERGVLVAIREDGKAEVIRVDHAQGNEGSKQGKAALYSRWEFEEDARDAVYSGTVDKQGSAYVNRLFFQASQQLVNFHVYWLDSKDPGGQGQITGFSFQFDHDLNGDILAAPFEVSPVSSYQVITRSAFITASGSVRLLQDDRHHWMNEEGLAETAAAVLVDLPERQIGSVVSADSQGGDLELKLRAAAARAVLEGETFFERLQRHGLALQLAPSWLLSVSISFIEGLKSLISDPRLFATSHYAAQRGAPPPPPKPTASEDGTTRQFKRYPAGGVAAAEVPDARRRVIPRPARIPQGGKAARPAHLAQGPPPPAALAPRAADSNVTAHLFRDRLGFRKVLVSATTRGKVYAMDTDTRTFVWEKSLVGFGAGEGAPVPIVNVRFLSVTRPVGGANLAKDSSTDKDANADAAAHLGPLITIVADVEEQGTTLTRVWELDPLTGVFPAGDAAQTGLPLLVGKAKDVFLLPFEDDVTRQQAVGAIDPNNGLVLWPRTPSVAAAFEKIAKQFFYLTHTTHQDQATGQNTSILSGFVVLNGQTLESAPAWQMRFEPGEEIVHLIHGSNGPIASQGKVLGNRKTMYKYLNPHGVVVVTRLSGPDSQRGDSAHVYVIDSASGLTLYSRRLIDDDLAAGQDSLQAAFAENWITVAYRVNGHDAHEVSTKPQNEVVDEKGSKAKTIALKPETRLLSLELYEAETARDQTWDWTGSKSSFSPVIGGPEGVRPFAQTYVLPHAITSLAMSKTKFGITSKSLLMTTVNGNLLSLPRRLLDPRRPVGRKPTSEELEEGLSTFDAYVPNAPQLSIGGQFRIEAPKGLVVAPAAIESTSLVAVLGLDWILVRIAPSGTFDMLNPTFNKPQLVLTIVALTVGLLVAKPMLATKTLKMRW
ncbi:Uncharacterized conserved protein [Ceraceosorus bombacis]|uniref:ER membrane protein complex subunit 1 n=1 Tax=Ceraceosorus bombacis TaxID=401625 RepID=A0A0N7LB05_9BASI|nr:Uncharacterized conserved protein [Ceraceosorus bombacis]